MNAKMMYEEVIRNGYQDAKLTILEKYERASPFVGYIF